jgi:hypothetical protein
LVNLHTGKSENNVNVVRSHSHHCVGFSEFGQFSPQTKHKFEKWIELLLSKEKSRCEASKFLFIHTKGLHENNIVINDSTLTLPQIQKKTKPPDFARKKAKKREYKPFSELGIFLKKSKGWTTYCQNIDGKEIRYHQYRVIKNQLSNKKEFVQFRCSKRRKTQCKASIWIRVRDSRACCIDFPHICQ